MATASATISPATIRAATAVIPRRSSPQRRTRVKYFNGLNTFDGLKGHNIVTSLGIPISTEKAFAKIVSSLREKREGNGVGSAFSSTCSAVAEIFRIAAILPALVLIGVAVGFVLLRLEATLEEE